MSWIADIKTGDTIAEACFDFDEEVNIESAFKYPFECFGKEGTWDINSKPFHSCSEEIQLLAEQLLHSKYDKIFYVQEGVNDGQSWYILAKVGKYYIYFEASCDYTGFNCRGAGTFGYSTDWKTLWNMYTTACFRSLLLAYYNYETLDLNMPLYNKEYMVTKLAQRKVPNKVTQSAEEMTNSTMTILDRMKVLSGQIKELDTRKVALTAELSQFTEQFKTILNGEQ